MTDNNAYKKQIRLRMDFMNESYMTAKRRICLRPSPIPRGALTPFFANQINDDVAADVKKLLAPGNKGALIIGSGTGAGKTTVLAALLQRLNDSQGESTTLVQNHPEIRTNSGLTIESIYENYLDSKEQTDSINQADSDVFAYDEMRAPLSYFWKVSAQKRTIATIHASVNNPGPSTASRLLNFHYDVPNGFDPSLVSGFFEQVRVFSKDADQVFYLQNIIHNTPEVADILFNHENDSLHLLKDLGVKTLYAKLEELELDNRITFMGGYPSLR